MLHLGVFAFAGHVLGLGGRGHELEDGGAAGGLARILEGQGLFGLGHGLLLGLLELLEATEDRNLLALAIGRCWLRGRLQ